MIGTLGSLSSKPPSLSAQRLPDWLERGVESSLRDTENEDPVSGPTFAAPVALSSQQVRASAVSTPIVLTPGGGSSPQPSKSGGAPSTKGAFMDLDKFYEDTEEVEGEESGEDDDEDDEDDDEEESGDDEDGEVEEAVVDEVHRGGSTHVEESGAEDDSSEDESDAHLERGLLNPP